MLHAGRQVVAGDGVPQRQQPAVQVEGALLVAARDRILQGDAGGRRRAEDRDHRAVRAEGERRVEQGVDRAQDQAASGRLAQQVGQQLHVGGALLDLDHARDVAQDAAQHLGRQIAPRHHVVADHRKTGLVGGCAIELQHRIVIRTEQVVHRGDLQRGHARLGEGGAALHHLAGAGWR